MEKIARKINGMGESKANKLIGFLCMIAVACWLALFANLAGMSLSAEAAKPPTSTTYWLITGHPGAPVRHQLPSDPIIDVDRNWIVINHADGTRSVFDQNCKVAYLNEATGEWDMVEYYGNDYIVAAESMGGFAPPSMTTSERQ